MPTHCQLPAKDLMSFVILVVVLNLHLILLKEKNIALYTVYTPPQGLDPRIAPGAHSETIEIRNLLINNSASNLQLILKKKESKKETEISSRNVRDALPVQRSVKCVTHAGFMEYLLVKCVNTRTVRSNRWSTFTMALKDRKIQYERLYTTDI